MMEILTNSGKKNREVIGGKPKAVFLDRDGTINIEKDYLYKIEDFEFLPGAIDGLRILQDAGYILLIITNQSGIARGYYKEEEFHKLNNWMKEELNLYGIKISDVYFCPHHPEAKVEKYRIDCNCRKPKLGMYEQAIKDYNIDLSQSYTIGDKIRDCAICKGNGCKGFLIAENEKKEIIQSVKNGEYEWIEYAVDLKDAAKRIVGETNRDFPR